MTPRTRWSLLLVLLLAAVLLILLLARCSVRRSTPAPKPPTPAAAAPAKTPEPAPGPAATAAEEPERLGLATVEAPARVLAGAKFEVRWTGPDNANDYISLVPPASRPDQYTTYAPTRTGNPVTLTAPVDPAALEIRYVTARSKTVLARQAVEVFAATATLDAASEAVAGSRLAVTWTGPANHGDFITVVPKEVPDGQYGNFEPISKGSPLQVLTPMTVGDAEVRYMTGQQQKVLARRAVKIVASEVSLSAPEETLAGSVVSIAWTGPKNAGDYITIVTASTPDGRYGNYTPVTKGSPLQVTAPMEAGPGEIRYMAGQGQKVLARRPLRIVAAEVTLSAPDEVVAGTRVPIVWTGPKNAGDYITIVAAGTPDGRYANYTAVTKGSPLDVLAPIDAGDTEIRYMAGQGGKVLQRRPLRVVAAKITLEAPGEAVAGGDLTVQWSGPNNQGDYLTVVAKDAKEGAYLGYTYTSAGSPLRVKVQAPPGPAELRYIAGQGAKTLARRPLTVKAAK
ncbi:hypothetical protein DB347_05395 [Opitutaceae bacterium EW11]|nr:hypothetical protein DB347_05395 [Opitutaceae bacterium EW11]